MNTFEILLKNKLEDVDCNTQKLSRADRQGLEIVNRANYLKSTLDNILRDGGSAEDLETLVHDFDHLKSLMTRKFGKN